MRVLVSCLLLANVFAVGCRPAADSANPTDSPTDGEGEATSSSRSGTAEERALLFDDIVAKTRRREAFSPVKNRALGLDVVEAMASLRDEFVSADSDEALYYALVKLSNARKDRHLTVRPVEGGLVVPGAGGFTVAPIRFAPDFTDSNVVFVADVAEEFPGNETRPSVGDRLVAVDGRQLPDYVAMVEPYHRYSTDAGFRWKLARNVGVRSALLPSNLRGGEQVTYVLERANGGRYEVRVPYLDPKEITWKGLGEPRYPAAFEPVYSTETFDLHRNAEDRVLLLRWHGFRETLVTDMDRLMADAQSNDWLGHDLIVDATRSRGGARGVEVLQRISAKPFRTTFGNLRLSDVIEPFVAEKRAEQAANGAKDAGISETMDGGSMLMDWLENDVLADLKAGRAYTANVPFKLAHLPKDSDGVARPASVHFTGKLVCLLGPHGGSHLDQFAAMVVDNELGHTIGMPTGGYSNTWEWTEVLELPGSGQPLASFMWSIGHTIRPNGEILEGNPAQVAERLPLSRDNATRYYELLVGRAMAHLGHG